MAQMTQSKPKETQKSNTQIGFTPLGNRVLVRRLEEKESLKGGIILPDTAKKKQEAAEVIAIGTGKKDKSGQLIPMPVKIGQVILMEKYSGQEISLKGSEYVILKADEIIAIIEQ